MKMPFKAFAIEIDRAGATDLLKSDVMTVSTLDYWSNDARSLLQREFALRSEVNNQVICFKKKRHYVVIPGLFFAGCTDIESVTAIAKKELDCSFAFVEDAYFLSKADPNILGFPQVIVFHRLVLADFSTDLWQLLTVQNSKEKGEVLSVGVIAENDFIKDLANRHVLFSR